MEENISDKQSPKSKKTRMDITVHHENHQLTNVNKQLQNVNNYHDRNQCRRCQLSYISKQHCWKKYLWSGKFWLAKCVQNGLPTNLYSTWFKIVEMVEDSCLERNIIKHLIKLQHRRVFESAIIIIAEAQDLVLLNYILKNVIKSIDQDEFGNTPIHIAAEKGHTEVVKTFVNCVECPNPPDHNGRTPLHIAALNGHIEIVKSLAGFCTTTANSPEINGWTPIHLAARKGHTEIVKVLINFTDKPNMPAGLLKWTPIHLAAMNGHIEVVDVLVSCTDFPNVSLTTGLTPIHLAAKNGHIDVVKSLAALSRSPNAPDCNGWTPSYFALQNGHSEVAELLISLNNSETTPYSFRNTLRRINSGIFA